MNKLNQKYINNLYQIYKSKFTSDDIIFVSKNYHSVKLIFNDTTLIIPTNIFKEYIISLFNELENIKIKEYKVYKKCKKLKNIEPLKQNINEIMDDILSAKIFVNFSECHMNKVIGYLVLECENITF